MSDKKRSQEAKRKAQQRRKQRKQKEARKFLIFNLEREVRDGS